MTIDIGTLEDWYTERTLLPLSKRRRLNVTADDIEVESDGDSDEEMVELNHTVEQPQLDKSLLYETWQEDFEKQKKLLNKKKRKRHNSSSVRSKSRSPTPTKSDPLQYQISRKASVKNSNDEESKNTCSAPMLTDSEEERKELEKIKLDILKYLF